MASYDFHPDALVEFEDATRCYLEQASPICCLRFRRGSRVSHQDGDCITNGLASYR
jgi:hypothetical protein